jgi:cation diffusion facilitator family transporter
VKIQVNENSMKQFPKPIPLPDAVNKARFQREHDIVKSAFLGVLIRLIIIAFELLGVYLYGSSSLLLDAFSSLLDVAATIVLILCIKLAARPPDREHPFGHGRYEPLIGLQLGLILVLVGAVMIFQQTFQLTNESNNIEALNPLAWMIPFCAVILLEICYRIVIHTSRKQNSPALAADAFHYRIDGLTSVFATIALLLGAFIPQWSHKFDHIGAVCIACFMGAVGLYAARKNLNQLLDHIPSKEYFEKVRLAALKVEGVKDTEKIRIQLYGPDAHVDIDVEVNPDLTVEFAHSISQKVRAEIQKDWPAVQDVTVHIEPFYPNDH